MGTTPSRQYDASASGEERELAMTFRMAVRNGDASDVVAACVRILSRSERSPIMMSGAERDGPH